MIYTYIITCRIFHYLNSAIRFTWKCRRRLNESADHGVHFGRFGLTSFMEEETGQYYKLHPRNTCQRSCPWWIVFGTRNDNVFNAVECIVYAASFKARPQVHNNVPLKQESTCCLKNKGATEELNCLGMLLLAIFTNGNSLVRKIR